MKCIAWTAVLLALAATTAPAQDETTAGRASESTQKLLGPTGAERAMTSDWRSAVKDEDEPVVEHAEAVLDVSDEDQSGGNILQTKLFGRLVPHATAGAELAHCGGCDQELTDCCCNACEWTAFGQWLLLQPRGADVLFAERAASCFGPPIGTEQIDLGAFSGFKVGIAKALHDGCSELAASFTFFESVEEDRARAIPPEVLRPVLAFDPFATCDDATSTFARAKAGIDFKRADVDYRTYIDCGCYRFDWLLGFGYGQLNQDVRAFYDDGRVAVESDAWGYGLRLGGGAQYDWGCIRGFGHVDLTLLASNVRASYVEVDNGTGVVDTTARVDRDFDRIIPVLDLEVGFAIDLCKNTVLKAGYVYSIWFNVITAPEFVETVQGGDLTGSSDTLTFDGIFARIEYTW